MILSNTLLDKYNKQGPRYTSYPPATFFTNSYDTETYRSQLISSNNEPQQNISLYFHIPFCNKLCHFCGCHSIAKPTESRLVELYVDALLKEIASVSKLIDKKRLVTQIHWGGGTPHSISNSLIAQIMTCVFDTFSVDEHAEIAMECNPAYTDLDFFDFLHSLRFNRISLGIQDFSPEILSISNRDAAQYPISQIVEKLRSLGMGVNFDLIYGLPGQTKEHFFASLDATLLIRPDRIATFSYAHVPWVKKAQSYLEKYTIPQANEKFAMLMKAYNQFTRSGYEAIGMDHFALQDDELTLAQKSKTLHRNFQGYTTGEKTGQVYAFGVSGISQMTGSYAQNVKSINDYIDLISKQGFATERGYILTIEDKVIREVISEIMCNKYIDFNQIATRFSLTAEKIKQIVNFDSIDFSQFIADELIVLNNETMEVTATGGFFIRNIAMAFDPKLEIKQGMYSKTV